MPEIVAGAAAAALQPAAAKAAAQPPRKRKMSEELLKLGIAAVNANKKVFEEVASSVSKELEMAGTFIECSTAAGSRRCCSSSCCSARSYHGLAARL
ncbi:unnamed protein product [Amoebophrya sp. A25]|nr:unnamed protein product [Amoebophrya sp. A25]|eukprot:GSA25T00019922001.1